LAFVEFALHPQHEASLDSGIQLTEDFNYFKVSQESDPEAFRWSHFE